MKRPRLFLILFLLVIVVICGCTQPVSDNGTEPAGDILSTPMTTVTTVTISPESTSVTPKDPIIGTWICYIYATWGKVEQEFTFMENNTWTRIITNHKSEKKEYAHGTWIKEHADNYKLTSSITGVSHIFEYNIANDELTDTNFELIFHRTAEAHNPIEPVPTISDTTKKLSDNRNFTDVVDQLTTPEKTL